MDGLFTFDDINRLGIKRRSESYSEYFSDMDLTDEQKAERESFSQDADDTFTDIMLLIILMREFGGVDEEYVTETLTSEYRAVVASYLAIDDYLDSYINDFATDFVSTTMDNIENAWYLSEDRVMFDSENEANTALNYKDYQKAILSGKKYKTWLTYGDSRVRKTHRPLDGKTIPITSLFEVGDSLMRYPRDMKYYPKPEQTINCRCSLHYS